ncbi:MAG TPA: hypothetical protein DCR55_05240 [Lentisphaeria bacterium]|nr:hypothetical protein [Lentisphaeria bacterium]
MRWLVVVALLACGCTTLKRPDAEALQGSVEHGGHRYKVFEMAGSWHQKRAHCKSLGGYLAVIESAGEQSFIAELAAGRYLSLGASDEEREDNWRWINGAAWEFTGWMDGQPNNYGEDEHYLATYDDGLWVDVAAEGDSFWMPIGCICEWDEQGDIQ